MLGHEKECVTLDIRQTIMESCALDGEGYCVERGRNMSVSRHKQNLADIRHGGRWGPRLRELKKAV